MEAEVQDSDCLIALTVNKFVTISPLKYLELAQGHIKGTLLVSQAEVFFIMTQHFSRKE